MKAVFAVVLALFVGQAEAREVDSKAIKAAVQEMGKGLGYKTVTGQKVKGRNLADMLADFCDCGSDEDEIRLNNEDFQDEDETSVGTTSMKTAFASIREFQEHRVDLAREEGRELDLAEMRAHYSKAVKMFQGTGVVFGYSGYGESVCGAIFTTILVIDTKAKVIYELGRGIGGPC